MASTKAIAAETMRMLFELDREDDPRLYDDLIRFNKGTKRINRLRLLAHEGERYLAGSAEPTPPVRQLPIETGVVPTGIPRAFDAPAAADVFADPITDGGVRPQEESHA
ncbi:hypothetical protein [Ottowia sp.]|uniref:hypothetical protein n=1 Tax=Ottowia sp. TaxID=1898956 RepID=UPI0026283AA7|nr:hypothetical protein [Ottowia sp.]